MIEKETLLSSIHTPDDLRKLPPNSLPQVCNELRDFIIDELSENPGHFASNLGAVELSVALHYVFNTPYDRIVWDVGHQAYGHKILTGRREQFSTNRKLGGLSGFPSPKESEYDAFTSGHASNSISAALGMAVASQLKGESDKHVVAVIGDAAISGGLAFEGLNNASTHPNNVLIILNDNDMAIDHNVGALNRYLVNIVTSPQYNKLRYDIYRALRGIHFISEKKKGSILRFNNSIKSFLTRQQNIFEGLNIRYFGPIDGHDTNRLVRVLTDLKSMSGPKLLHIRTTKGKGYSFAENDATTWHAPGKFNKENGERLASKVAKPQPPLFQDVFGKTLVELAERNSSIVGITPAMPSGCSMTYMMERFPKRTFDVGIAEEHAVTFSGGLAREGLLPFCNIYSTFMQRAFDQVIHDVAIQNLHVVFCLDRAGLVGEDGATHHGIFDMAYFRSIPNLIISSPIDDHYLRHLMYTAEAASNPFVIRYPRGRSSHVDWHCQPQILPIGKGQKLSDGNDDIALITIGPIGKIAQEVVEIVAKEHKMHVAHYDMIFLKPIDEELLHEIGKNYKRAITIEDGCIIGGLGTAVIEFMNNHHYPTHVTRVGIPDQFIEHGTVQELHKQCGMDKEHLIELIIK